MTPTSREQSGSAGVRRILWGPATLATYALLVVPFVVGTLKTSWMTPLALPGYLLFSLGSAVGNMVSPGLSLRYYWIPFFGGCYALAATVGYVWNRIRS